MNIDCSRNHASGLVVLYGKEMDPVCDAYFFSLNARVREETDLNVYSTAVHQSQFTPSTIAETYTYSRDMVLNKRSILTLRRNEINVSSDRTIFSTRLDSALSGNRCRRR